MWGGGATLTGSDTRIKSVKTTVGQTVKSILPQSPTAESGFTFAGWYIGDEEVNDQTVPKAGLTVTAKYTVGCTVKVYKQDVDGTYGEPETVEQHGLYGETFEYTPSEEHYSVDESKYNRLTTDSLTLGDEFAVYLKLDTFDVVYHDIDGEDDDTWEESGLLYGSSYTVEENMYGPFDGYRFAGWATEADGEVDAQYAVGTELTVSGRLDLYAVWDVAYLDRAGGFDYIYPLHAESGKVILDRGGYEFEGTVDDDGVFTIEYEGTKLTGKLDDETESFMYADVLQEGTYVAYNQYYSETLTDEERINDKETLVLNKYGEGTLTTDGESYKGVCVALEGGEWAFVTDEYDYFYFVTEKVGDKNCFTISGVEYGDYSEFVSTFGFLDGYDGDGLLMLDGYGGATWYDTHHNEYYYGVYNFNYERSAISPDYSLYIFCIELHVYATDAWLFGDSRYGTYEDRTVYCIIMDDGESDLVMLYVYEDTDALGTFTKAQGEDTLTLDGFGQYNDSVTLTEGDKTTEGIFFAYESEIFGTVVEATFEDDTTRYFALSDDDTYTELSGKPTEWVNVHVGEYENHVEFEDPYLIMYEEKDGEIPTDVYVDLNGTYTKVATGSCSTKTQGDYTIYTFHAERKLDEANCPFTSIVFLADEIYTKNEVLVRAYYIFEKDNVKAYKTFMSGEETIWFATFGYEGLGAFYKTADGTLYEGSFSITDGDNYWFESDKKYGVFSYVNENGRMAYLYFELTGGDQSGDLMTFTAVDTKPQMLYEGTADYDYGKENFCIGPDEEAQVRTDNASGEYTGVVHGTYTVVGKTDCGDDIYRFDPETNDLGVTSFEFVLEYGYTYTKYGMNYVIDVYHKKVIDPEVQLEFKVDDGSTLTGDGFWFKGTYNGILGELEGILYCTTDVDDNDLVIFETEDYGAIVFDLLPNGTLTMRDGLDGYYQLLDENSENANGWVLYLDGYGNLFVEDSGYNVLYKGYYVANEDGITELVVDFGNTILLQMDVVLYSGSGNYAFLIDYEVMGMYVASDLSMLYLDGMNIDSFYIDEYGNLYRGDYYLFDEFGAFNFSDGSRVFTFTYDMENLTYEKVDQSAYYGIYYANDMRDYYVFDMIAYTKSEKAGYYYVEEAASGYTVTMYLKGEYDSKFTKSTATLKDNVLTVGYVNDFYKLPDEITLTGTATFGGETQIDGLSLKFTLDDIDGSIIATLTNGSVEFEVKISGGKYLFMYYDTDDGFEQSPEIDFNLKTNSFTIACEYDSEVAALKAKLGITE